METYDSLLEFANRQVIINIYQGDELLERDGYAFERVQVLPDRIVFIRQEQIVRELPVSGSSKLTRESAFPRYFAIESDGIRTELYFP